MLLVMMVHVRITMMVVGRTVVGVVKRRMIVRMVRVRVMIMLLLMVFMVG